jgi:hypothetical protein
MNIFCGSTGVGVVILLQLLSFDMFIFYARQVKRRNWRRVHYFLALSNSFKETDREIRI